MAKTRELVKRRKAVRNIRKITRTMELIATARFKKVLDRASEADAYTRKTAELAADLSATVANVSHPLHFASLSRSILLLSGVLLTFLPVGCSGNKGSDEKAIREWTQQLASPEVQLRREAVEGLKGAGPNARSAIPALQTAMRDMDALVQNGATEALHNMAPDVEEAIPALIGGLTLQNEVTRGIAARGLAKYGSKAVPPLIKVLEEKDNLPLRVEAAKALGRLGAQAREAVPVLTAALKTQNPRPASSDNGNFRVELATALVRIDPKDEYAVKNLNDCLTDGNRVVRINAAFELARLNPGSKEAVGRLIEMHKSAYLDRPRVMERLGQLGPAAKDAFPLLQDVFLDPRADGRQKAAVALVQIDAPSAVVIMIKALSDKDESTRAAAASALGEAGPQARDAESALRELLKTEKMGRVQLAAREALKKIEEQK